MKKKSIYMGIIASLFITAVAGLTSCRFEDEDYFEESASLRLEHYLDSASVILCAPEYGWVMQYYCGTQNFQFEGFNLFAKFDESGKVLMAGNHRMLRDGNANTYTEDTSLYSLLQEDGPVLAFDTWNDVLTVFADPVNPFAAPNTISNDGQGMNGDYNFVLNSLSEDLIELTGERYRAAVRLVKCEMPWEDYIAVVAETKAVFTNTTITTYYLTNTVDTMYISGLRAGKMLYCERLDDPVQTDSMACCFTPTGFILENANTIGDSSFQEFTINADTSKLISGDVELIATWDSYIAGKTALWAFDETEFTDEMQAARDAIADALLVYNKNYVLKSLSLGKPSGGNAVNGLVATFYSNAAKSKTNSCGIELTTELVGFGEVAISVDDDPAGDTNLTTLTKKSANLPTAMKTFADLLVGSYSLTPNDYFLPTGAIYTSTSGGASFVLEAQ